MLQYFKFFFRHTPNSKHHNFLFRMILKTFLRFLHPDKNIFCFKIKFFAVFCQLNNTGISVKKLYSKLFLQTFGVKWFYGIQTNEQNIYTMGGAYLSIICIFSFGQIFQLVLDPILIFGYFGFPALGTAGAAIATVTGQIIAMTLGFIINLKCNKEIQFSAHNLRLDKTYVQKICAVGIPAGITMLISSIMSFGINKILLTFSTTAAAVFGAYFKLYTFVSMATFGLNSAYCFVYFLSCISKEWVNLLSPTHPCRKRQSPACKYGPI